MWRLKIENHDFKEEGVQSLIIEDCPKCSANSLYYPISYKAAQCPHCKAGMPGAHLTKNRSYRKVHHTAGPGAWLNRMIDGRY
jgi:hypothetical protein